MENGLNLGSDKDNFVMINSILVGDKQTGLVTLEGSFSAAQYWQEYTKGTVLGNYGGQYESAVCAW